MSTSATRRRACLLVGDLRRGHVGIGAFLSSDEVVAVDRRRASGLGQAGRDELKHGHLGGRVLRDGGERWRRHNHGRGRVWGLRDDVTRSGEGRMLHAFGWESMRRTPFGFLIPARIETKHAKKKHKHHVITQENEK